MMLSKTEQKAVLSQFAQLPLDQIPSRKLRRQARYLRSKQGGFTLLELLVVITIVAVMGGLAIGAFGDKTSKAAKSSATNSLASLDSAVRGFQATAGVLPNNLDTLVCAEPTATALSNAADFGGTSDLPGVGGGMGAKLNGKMDLRNLTTGMTNALASAGIGTLRYGLIVGTDSACDTLDGAAIPAPAALTSVDFGAGFNAPAPGTYPNGSLASVDIPNRGFDAPVAGGSNRGRGFAANIGTGSTYTGGAATVPVQVWQRGGNGANNIKVGGSANDVLVTFGLGNNASIITDPANAALASAAFYADVGKDKYGRYMMLVKVGTAAAAGASITQTELDAGSALTKARFLTMIDARGDFLDEEYAESTGQKL